MNISKKYNRPIYNATFVTVVLYIVTYSDVESSLIGPITALVNSPSISELSSTSFPSNMYEYIFGLRLSRVTLQIFFPSSVLPSVVME